MHYQSMGLFGSVIATRVRQILRKELGKELDIDFIADGQFTCDHLQFTINPFYAAITDEGIYFIHDAQVVLILGWPRILKCESSSWDQGTLELMIIVEQLSQTAPPREWPYFYWHECKLRFKNLEDQHRFVAKFKQAKLRFGFNNNSLDLYMAWTKFQMGLPVESSRFIRDNTHLGDEKEILKAYYGWGWANDGLRLLYYTGRSACEGLLPGELILKAFEICKTRYQEYSKSLGNREFTDEIQNLIELTSKLPLSKSLQDSGQWVIGTLPQQSDEYNFNVDGIEIGERLAILNLKKGRDHPQKFFVWNDFHHGTKINVVQKMEFITKSGYSMIGTNLGTLRLSQEERASLTALETDAIEVE